MRWEMDSALRKHMKDWWKEEGQKKHLHYRLRWTDNFK